MAVVTGVWNVFEVDMENAVALRSRLKEIARGCVTRHHSHHYFGFAETRLQAMVMKGLLVLSQFHGFKDDSGRADYFVREYYALTDGR